MRSRRWPLAFVCVFVLAATGLPAARAQDQDVLRPEKAYPYRVEAQAKRLVLKFDAADGYYLYRERFAFASKTEGVRLGEPEFPKGQIHEDEFFGKKEIYRGAFQIAIPYTRDADVAKLALEVRLQGCADLGICYPPQTWTRDVRLPPAGANAAGPPAATAASAQTPAASPVTPATPPLTRAPSPLTPAPPPLTPAPSPLGPAAPVGPAAPSPFLPGAGDEPLPIDQAFSMDARFDGPNELTVAWRIQPGYYLYRDKLGVTADGGIDLGKPVMPAGEAFSDANFGDVRIFRKSVELKVPFARATPDALPVTIHATFQGCKEGSVCYLPSSQTMTVTVPAADAFATSAADASAGESTAGTAATGAAAASAEAPVTEQSRLAAIALDSSWLGMLGWFYLAGLALAFTPCVLPMVPIISGIIAGHGEVSTRRGFALSSAYVLGMAFTYTVAGALAALVGQQVQALFQKPWIIVLFAGFFVLLALSMFGAYNLQMPAVIQTRLANLANRQRAGTFLGTGIMGALSALIVTTCVAPALVVALALIGQRGDVVRGAAALFALSLGMGSPLLLVGASAGALLPRAGSWMNTVKAAFGVMMLGLAIWMLERVLPGTLVLVLWAVLVFLTGVFLGAFEPLPAQPGAARRLFKGVGVLACLYGALMLIGATLGGEDPLQPIPHTRLLANAAGADSQPGGEAAPALAFRPLTSVAALETALSAARGSGRPVLVDFTADWCVSCKEMEKYTFSNRDVMAALRPFMLLRADVTANDDEDRALLKYFGSYGPPTIAFFDAHGHQRESYKLVGYVPAEQFAAHVRRLAAL